LNLEYAYKFTRNKAINFNSGEIALYPAKSEQRILFFQSELK